MQRRPPYGILRRMVARKSFPDERHQIGNAKTRTPGEMTREKSLDAWGAGYHVGVLSANPDSHGKTTYDHFYHYKLKDAKAAVEIRATDCFGKVYTQNVFTTAAETDYPMVDNYPAVAE